MLKTKRTTNAAILLALAIVFQNLRMIPILAQGTPQSALVISSLVNLVLIVAAEFAGLWYACFIGFVLPITAFLQGQVAFVPFIPMVAIGNAIFPLAYYFGCKAMKLPKGLNKIIAVIIGAGLKFGFLFLAMPFVFRVSIMPTLTPEKGAVMLKAIQAQFGLVQLTTALVGGFLAVYLIKILQKKGVVTSG